MLRCTGTMKRALQMGQVMTRTPICCDRYQSLLDVRDRMAARKIRHLPVVEDGSVVGILSAGDIDTLHRSPHVDLARATVADAMTPAPYIVPASAPVAEVVRVMAEKRYGSVVIVDRTRRPRGIFTTVDALALLARLAAGGRPLAATGASPPRRATSR
jgi:acetoin utilization protein AcuB